MKYIFLINRALMYSILIVYMVVYFTPADNDNILWANVARVGSKNYIFV